MLVVLFIKLRNIEGKLERMNNGLRNNILKPGPFITWLAHSTISLSLSDQVNHLCERLFNYLS